MFRRPSCHWTSCEITQNPLLWLHRADRCALHGFLGQSQHYRFISPPGWFTQALGLTSDLYKVYQVPGFQRVRGYFHWRVWSHQSQVLKNFPGFCHLAHVCAVLGELLGWQWPGTQLRPSSIQALASLVPRHVSLFFVGKKNPVLVRSPDLFIFNRLVVISFFFFFS